MRNEITKLKKELKLLEAKLKNIGPVMRGSIVELKIFRGKKKYPAYYFSVKINNKTKLIYLGKKKLKIAKKYNDNYTKLKNIIEKMTEVSLELIRLAK